MQIKRALALVATNNMIGQAVCTYLKSSTNPPLGSFTLRLSLSGTVEAPDEEFNLSEVTIASTFNITEAKALRHFLNKSIRDFELDKRIAELENAKIQKQEQKNA